VLREIFWLVCYLGFEALGAQVGGGKKEGKSRASAQGAAWKDRAPIFPTTPKFVGTASVAAPVERFEFRRKSSLGSPQCGLPKPENTRMLCAS